MDCPSCGSKMDVVEDIEEDAGGNTCSFYYWDCPCCDEIIDYTGIVLEE